MRSRKKERKEVFDTRPESLLYKFNDVQVLHHQTKKKRKENQKIRKKKISENQKI